METYVPLPFRRNNSRANVDLPAPGGPLIRNVEIEGLRSSSSSYVDLLTAGAWLTICDLRDSAPAATVIRPSSRDLGIPLGTQSRAPRRTPIPDSRKPLVRSDDIKRRDFSQILALKNRFIVAWLEKSVFRFKAVSCSRKRRGAGGGVKTLIRRRSFQPTR